jgi:competence protein ComEA
MRAMPSRAHASSIVMTIGAVVVAPMLVAQTSGQPAATADPRSRFPAGRGRDALFTVCSGCHGPESVLGHFKTRDEWRKTLDEMADNGAQASDGEWTDILEYLARNYSLIFVNTATAQDLASMLDVAPAVADAIVGRRAERGRYKNIDELMQVPGVAAATIEPRKDRFVF